MYCIKVELLVEFTELHVEDSSDNDCLATPFVIFHFDFVNAVLRKHVQKAPASITSSFQVPASLAEETKQQLVRATSQVICTDSIQQHNVSARASRSWNLEQPIATSSAFANTALSDKAGLMGQNHISMGDVQTTNQLASKFTFFGQL